MIIINTDASDCTVTTEIEAVEVSRVKLTEVVEIVILASLSNYAHCSMVI